MPNGTYNFYQVAGANFKSRRAARREARRVSERTRLPVDVILVTQKPYKTRTETVAFTVNFEGVETHAPDLDPDSRL